MALRDGTERPFRASGPWPETPREVKDVPIDTTTALSGRIPALRAKLLALRDELRREIAATARDLATPPEDRGEDLTASQHPADVASDLELREDLVAGELKHEREAREIDAALARMDAKTYGTCVDCGAPIPLDRLEVRPQASRDVGCQRRAPRP